MELLVIEYLIIFLFFISISLFLCNIKPSIQSFSFILCFMIQYPFFYLLFILLYSLVYFIHNTSKFKIGYFIPFIFTTFYAIFHFISYLKHLFISF